MSTVTVEPKTLPSAISGLPQPKSSLPPLSIVASSSKRGRTVVRVGPVEIGTGRPVVIAGPCSVESYDQTRATA
jgi:3-deoxy-D-arabino-heptulosonate 7-phosphate (DAHP) synthase